MSRSSRSPYEPWFHKASGCWAKKVGGKVVYLSRDYRIAKQKLKELIKAEAAGDTYCRQWLDAPFATLADEFLEDIKARRAAGTYRNYREQLLRAMNIFGVKVKVGELRRIHLAKVEREMTGEYSPATIRDTIAVVQQVFSWAVKHDLLEVNPVAKYEKPKGGGRTRLMTDEEFQSLLRHADANFRRFLMALRVTGCRPGEVRQLTWEMTDLKMGVWVFRKHKTVTMQRDPAPRIIPLPDTIWNLCRQLAKAAHEPTDFVFTNKYGKPYSKDCIVKKMARIRKKAGIEKKHGENVVAYTNRHTYATRAIGRVSDTELAELMGHTTTRTLRRYLHLDVERLRDIQRRTKG